ncbi:MAG: VOC family protein [Sphingomonadaceae bacterium]|uniref:VOC family protein n=1 Tax=Thermaurantiacus sp. TaxID=2820283 RepID=UPI00298F215B|nr:VOC family protein [Thermaurantiacus sp.]MCS6985868.1 VOC family protein [Sphingomonadaceae bacterium]MDW8413863.1 VOC family protein [Thermaurantiacus sp.]
MIKGIHHSAFRCRDAEETRRFYEDVLGLPLAAALAFEEEPGSGQPHPYVHIFFRLPDGNFIAFFDAPDSARPEHFRPAHGFDRHIAFEVGSVEELESWRARLSQAGVPCFGPIDHHFVKSIYMWDPNGLQVEITARTPGHDAILAEEAQAARRVLEAWSERTKDAKRPLAA